jgi:hypothetical protein
MQIVIDIPEETYEYWKNHSYEYVLAEAIKNGTPLSKGHGRLIDADNTLAKAWANFYKHEDEWEKKDKNYLSFGRLYGQNGFECCQQTIVNAPAIIEADRSDVI